MARVSTYLNFPGTTEAAFAFYQAAFKTPFNPYANGKIARFGDMPPQDGQPPLSEADKHAVLHIELQTLGEHVLMGTDALASMGFHHQVGNNSSINLEPDTRAQADELFAALSVGGENIVPMQDMFWGAYYGSFKDKFGVQWMINCNAQSS
jgi:PhnB protein